MSEQHEGKEMIDITKKYQTRDGQEVVALFHYPENNDGYRIIAHIRDDNGEIGVYSFCEDGVFMRHYPHHNLDLIPVPTKVTQWFNVYKDGDGSFKLGCEDGYKIKRDAEYIGGVNSSGYIKTISIEVEIP